MRKQRMFFLIALLALLILANGCIVSHLINHKKADVFHDLPDWIKGDALHKNRRFSHVG